MRVARNTNGNHKRNRLTKKDDEIIENSRDMSEALNQYFISVFMNDTTLTTLPDTDKVLIGREDKILKNLNITSQQVIQEIDKLKINKSPGVDEIFTRVVRDCKNIISVPLTDIFNQ